jgi:hypothetical protein
VEIPISELLHKQLVEEGELLEQVLDILEDLEVGEFLEDLEHLDKEILEEEVSGVDLTLEAEVVELVVEEVIIVEMVEVLVEVEVEYL